MKQHFDWGGGPPGPPFGYALVDILFCTLTRMSCNGCFMTRSVLLLWSLYFWINHCANLRWI